MRRLCDLESGACVPAPLSGTDRKPRGATPDIELIYVGDPMCSWCWGISPGLKQLRAHVAARGIAFSIVVGGLRPGGGDPWTPRFRSFLRSHWEEIAARTGQRFSFALLDRPAFNYDTEPSCRAVVVARDLLARRDGSDAHLYEFFLAVQEKFYAKGEDPTQVEFYRSISGEVGLVYDDFAGGFASAEAYTATRAEFDLNRSWGVRAFPSVLLRSGDRMNPVASGFSTGEEMIETVTELLKVSDASVAGVRPGDSP